MTMFYNKRISLFINKTSGLFNQEKISGNILKHSEKKGAVKDGVQNTKMWL